MKNLEQEIYNSPPTHWLRGFERDLGADSRWIPFQAVEWSPRLKSRWQGSWPRGVHFHPTPTTITSITPKPVKKNRNTVNVTIEPKFTTIPGMYTFTCSLLWHLGTSEIPGLISVITEVFHLGTRGRSGGGVGAVKPSDQIWHQWTYNKPCSWEVTFSEGGHLAQILNQFSFPRDGGVGVAKFLKGSQPGDQQLCHARPYIVSSGDLKKLAVFQLTFIMFDTKNRNLHERISIIFMHDGQRIMVRP